MKYFVDDVRRTLKQCFRRYLRAGANHSPEVLALGGDGVEGRRRSQISDDERESARPFTPSKAGAMSSARRISKTADSNPSARAAG